MAEGIGFVITWADIQDLRLAYVPALEPGAASRLAPDVWLAEWIATGAIGDASLRQRIAVQQRLAMEHGDSWRERLADAGAELGLRKGPCYVESREASRPRATVAADQGASGS